MYTHDSQPSVLPSMRKCLRAACIFVFLCQSATASKCANSPKDSGSIHHTNGPTDSKSILNLKQTARQYADAHNGSLTQAWHESTATDQSLHDDLETEMRADREFDFDEGSVPDKTFKRDTFSTISLTSLIDYALFATVHVDYTLLEESEDSVLDPLSHELQLLSLDNTKHCVTAAAGMSSPWSKGLDSACA